MNSIELFARAGLCLQETDLEAKLSMSETLVKESSNGFSTKNVPKLENVIAGRPLKPELVSPSNLPRRGFSSPQSRLAMIHAIAHIEFNAINLAWDAIYRFRDMPIQYYRDWIKVAGEETRHFRLLRAYLNKHKLDYGDLDAHDGLWRMAEQTDFDVLARMAIVPRVLEAKGLDVTPAMISRFEEYEEQEVADILRIIYREEIGHVKIGNTWFKYLCEKRKLEADRVFVKLIKQFKLQKFTSKINREGRIAAGFRAEELDALEQEFLAGT